MVDLFQCLITCNCLADLSYLDTKTAFFITLRVMTVKNVNRPIFKQLYNSRPIYPFITQFNGIDSIPLAFHWVRTIIDAAVILMWYQGSPLWRHQMETFSTLLALCAGISPFTGEFPSQSTITRSFDVFFDLRLDIRLNKHWFLVSMRCLVRWNKTLNLLPRTKMPTILHVITLSPISSIKWVDTMPLLKYVPRDVIDWMSPLV